ncbi:MAG: hypothetical protein GF313_16690 [Caldithrix sp.]|nr:hypothetical protein [Caldithrix sp.]
MTPIHRFNPLHRRIPSGFTPSQSYRLLQISKGSENTRQIGYREIAYRPQLTEIIKFLNDEQSWLIRYDNIEDVSTAFADAIIVKEHSPTIINTLDLRRLLNTDGVVIIAMTNAEKPHQDSFIKVMQDKGFELESERTADRRGFYLIFKLWQVTCCGSRL